MHALWAQSFRIKLIHNASKWMWNEIDLWFAKPRARSQHTLCPIPVQSQSPALPPPPICPILPCPHPHPAWPQKRLALWTSWQGSILRLVVDTSRPSFNFLSTLGLFCPTTRCVALSKLKMSHWVLIPKAERGYKTLCLEFQKILGNICTISNES